MVTRTLPKYSSHALGLINFYYTMRVDFHLLSYFEIISFSFK